jgi:predicted glycosyltransferase
MKILLGLWHPAHVHTFRNAVWKLEEDGHDIKIVITNKDITKSLLDLYDITYTIIGESHSKGWHKGVDLVKLEYQLIKTAYEFQPDLFLGRGSAAMAHASRLLRRPYIAFHRFRTYLDYRTESIFPFMDVIITPTAYSRRLNPKKHIKINTYKELAYLHPNQFQPDPSVLDSCWDLREREVCNRSVCGVECLSRCWSIWN